MTYIFKCTKCNKKDERDIPISDYDIKQTSQDANPLGWHLEV